MINTSKLGTLVYLHTLDVHIMYYLKITGIWNHSYIYCPQTIEYTYLLRRRFISTKQTYKKIIHTIPNTLYTKRKKKGKKETRNIKIMKRKKLG